MKRTWLAVIAAVAVLCCTDHKALAQTARGPAPVYMGSPHAAQYAPQYAAPMGVYPAGYMADGGGYCTSGSCAAPGGPGCQDCNDPAGWTSCYFAYGGFTYLRPRDAEITYGVVANGPNSPNPAIQRGALGVLDMDYQPGFYVGFGKYIDECSSIGVQYTRFEGTTNDGLLTAPLVNGQSRTIRSFVFHPSTNLGNVDNLQATASQDINFDILDVDYRNLIAYDYDYQLNFLVGFRGAQLEQRFNAVFSDNGTRSVATDIDFYGAGVRLGLEGERYTRRGFMVYGKTYASFIPGEFRADYAQRTNTNTAQVDAGWRAGRIVTMLDLELGFGWRNQCDTIRASVGYVFSSWLNVVQTDEWIRGVQTNDTIDMSDRITFDGLVARIEMRW